MREEPTDGLVVVKKLGRRYPEHNKYSSADGTYEKGSVRRLT